MARLSVMVILGNMARLRFVVILGIVARLCNVVILWPLAPPTQRGHPGWHGSPHSTGYPTLYGYLSVISEGVMNVWWTRPLSSARPMM